MENKLWFKAKRYGWGWVPSSWEGWLVTAAYIAIFTAGMLVFVYRIEQDHTEWDLVAYFGFVLATTSAMIWISHEKGEPPRWRWGEDN